MNRFPLCDTRRATGLWACFLIAVFALASLAPATASADDLPRIYVGIYLHDVSTFDQKNGVFDVDADVWAKWRGDFDPNRIRVANGARIEMESLGMESNGNWHSKKWRLRGTLRGEFPLHRFPFDEQTLGVIFELPEDQGRLVPDLAGSGMEESFSVTDWHYEPEFHPAVSSDQFRSDLGNLAFEGGQATLNRVGFEVVLKRPIRPVVLKLFLPLAIVALIVLASLFVHPNLTQPRVTMGVTGLVAAFAFQFSISDVLPDVAYITLADTLFIIVYTLSVACVAGAVLAHELQRHNRGEYALYTDRALRVILPFVMLVMIWNAIPDPYPPHIIEPDPIPEMERTKSERDVVRIGTTQRLRVASSPPTRASYWPLAYNDPDAGPQALGVEQVPRVDSEVLRFLAGGELEVRWTIREGAKWSDGQPLTTQDILLPLEASPDPYIVETRLDGERTVILRWSDRLARALQAPELWPSHILEDKYHSEGYEEIRDQLGEAVLPAIGPYHIVDHDDDRLITEANPHFVGTAPGIERVELFRYDDSNSLTDAFIDGEIDITDPNNVDDEDLARIRAQSPENVHQSASANLIFLQVDFDHPLLNKIEIRRAIARALNRERYIEDYFSQGSRVAHSPMTARHTDDIETWEWNPDAARNAVEDIVDSDIVIPFTYPSSTSDEFIEAIIEDLEEVGLHIEPHEVGSAWRPWRENNHGGLLLHTLRSEPDAEPRRWWNLPQEDGRYVADARHDAYTDAVHELVEREMRALYPERNQQLQEALFAAWSQNLPSIPLLFTEETLLATPSLKAWQRPTGQPFGHGLETWYFSSSE